MCKLTKILRISWLLLRETIAAWQKDKASMLSAALAYYTIFALAPLLIIVIAIAGFFFGEAAVRSEVFDQLQSLVGNEGAKIVQTTLQNIQNDRSQNSWTASLISLSILFIGATGVFVQLQDALNMIWNVKPKPKQGLLLLIRSRILSFSMVVGIGFLLLVSLVASAVLSAMSRFSIHFLPGAGLVWQGVNASLSLVVITFLFAMIFKFLPEARIDWQDVWIGSAMTTCLFVAGKSLLGIYLGQSSFSSTYGAAGSLVIIVAWVYYSAQLVFFGAEFTQVYARRYGSRITPNRRSTTIN